MSNQTLIRPSQLGIAKVSYKDIFNGKLNAKVRLPLHQQGVLKAMHDLCAKNNRFVPLSSKTILKHLQNTEISKFLPAGDITPDMAVMTNRGWLDHHADGYMLSEYAQEQLQCIN